jgi:hypothetical protein
LQRRPVRSGDDLLALDAVPLLGTINWGTASPPRKLASLLPRRLRLT